MIFLSCVLATTGLGDPHSHPMPAFEARIEYAVAGKPEFLLLTDLDGDGSPDLVVAQQTPGELVIARGGIAALERSPEIVAVGAYPLRPVALSWKPAAGAPAVRAIAVVSRATRKLDVIDLARRNAPKVLLDLELDAVPRALTTVEDGGETVLVIATEDRGLLAQHGSGALVQVAPRLEGSVPCTALGLQDGAHASVLLGFQDSCRVVEYSIPGGAPRRRLDLPGIPRDLVVLPSLRADPAPADASAASAGVRGGSFDLVVVGGDGDGWMFAGRRSRSSGESVEGEGPAAHLPLGPIPLRILARDLDGDDRDDLVVLTYYGVACEVWKGRAQDAPTISTRFYVGQTPSDLALGDLDGDGVPDLAVANRDAHRVSFVRGLRGGSFATAPEVRVGSFPTCVRAAHFAPGSPPSLVVVNAKESALSIVERRGDVRTGWFETSRPLCARAPRTLLCTDLDGDGSDEVVLLARDANESVLEVWSRDEEGKLARRDDATSAPFGRGASALCAVRRPADSVTDLWVADPETNEILRFEARVPPSPASKRRVEIALCDRLQAASGPCAFAPLVAAEAAAGATARLPYSVAVALQGPGSGAGIQMVALVRDGTTAARGELVRTWRSSGIPRDVCAADLDGDGAFDLALLCRDADHTSASSVEVWLQRSQAFVAGPRLACGASAFHLAAVDLDGDGRAEILVAAQDSHAVDVLRPRLAIEEKDESGEKHLEFEALPALGAGLGCIDLAIADLDGDGRLDVAVANSAGDGISLLFDTTQR